MKTNQRCSDLRTKIGIYAPLNTNKKNTMEKRILILIGCLLPILAGAQPNQSNQPYQPKPLDLTQSTNMVEQQLGTPPLIPSPNWHVIASRPGPNIAPGWQIVNIETVLQNGNSMTAWLMYLYNPSTRQTMGYLIGMP